jgi:uncharacterized membrane protein YbhN (UPF0104 family)
LTAAKQSFNYRKWVLRLIKATIVVLVIGGVTASVVQARTELSRFEWTLRPWWLAAAGGLYLLSILPCAIFWHYLLRALGQRPNLGETLRAYYIGHLGKYVPGKALVVVIRTWLIQGGRVDASVAAVSVFVETLTMMAVGAFWAATILLLAFPEHGWLVLLAAALMIAAGLPTLPPVFRAIVARLPLPRLQQIAHVDLGGLTYRLMVGGWIGISVGWVLMGLSLWATLHAIGVQDLDPLRQLPLYTASVSLAVVAGFLSGIPGGAVVREGILWALLAVEFTKPVALVAAIFLRLIWLLSELVISGILYMAVRRTAAGVGGIVLLGASVPLPRFIASVTPWA